MDRIDNFFNTIESFVVEKTKDYKIVFKHQGVYAFPIAELTADFSIERYTPDGAKLIESLLFIDASKVFDKGGVEDAVLSIPYRYGTPDSNILVHVLAQSGFTLNTIKVCKENPWLRLFRLANVEADFRLHRNNHIPYAIDEDQDDFLADDAKQNQFYAQDKYQSVIEYLNQQDIEIKKGLRLKPDYLSVDIIQQRANDILSKIDLSKTGLNRLYAIAEYLQVDVISQLMSEELFGYYSVVDNAIVLNAKFNDDSNFRDRFTFAHELGHRALHKDLFKQYNISQTEDDSFSTINNIELPDQSKTWLEWQANTFASVILMPQDEITKIFINCVGNLGREGIYRDNMLHILRVGKLWVDSHDSNRDNREAAYAVLTEVSRAAQVSKEAIKFRLHKLGLIQTPNKQTNTELFSWLRDC